MKIYKNGKSIDSAQYKVEDNSEKQLIASAKTINAIGKGFDSEDSSFCGVLTEFRVHSKLLSVTEIKKLLIFHSKGKIQN